MLATGWVRSVEVKVGQRELGKKQYGKAATPSWPWILSLNHSLYSFPSNVLPEDFKFCSSCLRCKEALPWGNDVHGDDHRTPLIWKNSMGSTSPFFLSSYLMYWWENGFFDSFHHGLLWTSSISKNPLHSYGISWNQKGGVYHRNLFGSHFE